MRMEHPAAQGWRRRQPSPMSAPADGEHIAAGARVRVQGLASAASADLNGRAGICTAWAGAYIRSHFRSTRAHLAPFRSP
jgi:hypothetical protein